MADPRPPATERYPDLPLSGDSFYGTAQQGGGVDPREMLDIVWRGKWIILAAVLAVTIPFTIWTMRKPDVYQAYSLVLVEKQENAPVLFGSGGGSSLFGRVPEQELANEILLLQQSVPLAEQAARRVAEYGAVPDTGEPLSVLGGGEAAESPDITRVAMRLQGSYTSAAMFNELATAIQITGRSTSPGEAALVANVMAETFVDHAQRSSRESVVAQRVFLDSLTAERSAELTDLDNSVRQFMQSEQAVALDSEPERIVTQLGNLEAERDLAEIEARQASARIDALQAELDRIEPRLSAQVASNDAVRIAAAREAIQALQEQAEPTLQQNPEFRTAPDSEVPPEVRRVRREIARLEAEIAQRSARVTDESIASGSAPGDAQTGFARVSDLRRQIAQERSVQAAAEAKARQAQRRIGEYEGELAELPAQSIELAQLQRRRLATERVVQALDENLQQARVQEESELGSATMIRPAYAPDAPFSPNRPRDVLVGLFLGLTVGLVAAYVRVRADHRIHRPDDIDDLGVPLLGTIPDTTDLVRKDFGGSETVDVGGRPVDSRLVTLLNPMATASETYRALRTSVQFSRPDAVIETLLVTSPSPADGKSVTAMNLAVVMAQAGRRTLLVDGDLRRPTVHKKLGLAREPGLVQQLFRDEPLRVEDTDRVADDLWVLPAGSHAPNPAELLGSKRMRELIEEARGLFDVVVFDVPPVLAATDAVLLSTQCDATIVVARAGRTNDFDLRSALEALESVGGKVIGLVLNGFDASKAYGYRYKYSYRYGRDYYAYGANADGTSGDGDAKGN